MITDAIRKATGPIRIATNDVGLYPWLIRRPVGECVTWARGKGNLKLSHSGPSQRQGSNTNAPMRFMSVSSLRLRPDSPSNTCMDPEWGTRVRTPLKNHKNIGFPSNTGPDPLYQASSFNVGPS